MNLKFFKISICGDAWTPALLLINLKKKLFLSKLKENFEIFYLKKTTPSSDLNKEFELLSNKEVN